MKKVGIADLKERLSEHLRKVRRGQTLTVLDRETPIARIVPFDAEAPSFFGSRVRWSSTISPLANPSSLASFSPSSVLARSTSSGFRRFHREELTSQLEI